MRWFTITLIAVFSVIILCSQNAKGLTRVEKERILKGLDVAKVVAKTMEGLNAVKWVAEIGSVINPILTVAVMGVKIALMFVKVESPEMILLKEEFAVINNRLDQFSIKFTEVKRKIEWKGIQLTYDKYEKTIDVLNSERIQLANIDDKHRFEIAKANFISKYERIGTLVSEKLYEGMSTSTILSNNIFEAARIYTGNHEMLTFEFIKGSMQLLIQAFSIDVTYIQLKYNNSNALEYMKKDAAEKIKNVQENAENIKKHIHEMTDKQMKIDVNKEMIMAMGLRNEYFAKYLYNFLDEKFPWRQWFVLSYNEASDARKHASVTCGGAKFVNVAKRNIVIASTKKNATTSFTKSWAQTQFSKVPKFQLTHSNDYAQQVLNKLLPLNGKCKPAAVLAVVRGKDHRLYVADAYVYTDRNRLFWKPYCTMYCNTSLCWVKKEKCFSVIMWG